jgi:hypothetical protein
MSEPQHQPRQTSTSKATSPQNDAKGEQDENFEYPLKAPKKRRDTLPAPDPTITYQTGGGGKTRSQVENMTADKRPVPTGETLATNSAEPLTLERLQRELKAVKQDLITKEDLQNQVGELRQELVRRIDELSASILGLKSGENKPTSEPSSQPPQGSGNQEQPPTRPAAAKESSEHTPEKLRSPESSGLGGGTTPTEAQTQQPPSNNNNSNKKWGIVLTIVLFGVGIVGAIAALTSSVILMLGATVVGAIALGVGAWLVFKPEKRKNDNSN